MEVSSLSEQDAKSPMNKLWLKECQQSSVLHLEVIQNGVWVFLLLLYPICVVPGRRHLPRDT